MERKKSNLFGKFDKEAREAHEKGRGETTTNSDYGSLPEGIENGIAQLKEVKIDAYKTGELKGSKYLMLTAVVVEPVKHKGIKVEGKQIRLIEPMCNTPKNASRPTFTDHYNFMLKQFRTLGIDTKVYEYEDVELMIQQLIDEQPYFTFRTWKGKASEKYPNPKVNVSWQEKCDYEPTHEDDVEISEDDQDQQEQQEEVSSVKNNRGDNSKKGSSKSKEDKKTENEDDSSDDSEGDEEVEESDDESDGDGSDDSSEDDESDSDGLNIDIGDTASYSPPDPVKKGKRLKPRDVKIIKIDEDEQTVDLQDLIDTKKIYKKVAISELVTT